MNDCKSNGLLLEINMLLECDCYEEGTIEGNRCQQNNSFCICKDGWFGYKCLFGKNLKLFFS